VQRSFAASGRITAFVHNDGYDYVEGEAGEAYGGTLKRFRRHVVHVKPGVFVMFDDLVATKPATFQWLLHAYEKIQIEDSSRSLHVRREPAAMKMRFLWPPSLSFSQTDRYNPDPERVKPGEIKNSWHLTASTKEPSATRQFLTVLVPYRIGQEASVPQAELVNGNGAIGVRLIASDGFQELVAFRTGEARAAVCGGLRSDARVFARGARPDGTVVRRLLVDGEKCE